MKAGDIIVIPFPFTNLAGQKIRPAYVLSNEKYNTFRNIVVAAISTKAGVMDLAIELSEKDIKNGILQKKSYIRFQNIFTIEKRLIQQKVGECTLEKKNEVQSKLLEMF